MMTHVTQATEVTCNTSDIVDFVDGVFKRKGECTVIVDGVEWLVTIDDIVRYTYRDAAGNEQTLEGDS